MAVSIKPQDILVLLKLVAMGRRPWSYAWLAGQLGMSPSQLHSAIKRLLAARLALRAEDIIVADIRNLEEFLVHALKYVCVPERGEIVRGIATAHAAQPLKGYFATDPEPPPVWPDANGDVRGASFSPLYKLAPGAARVDPKLYELLALADTLRGGRARDRDIAIRLLHERLHDQGSTVMKQEEASDYLQVGAQLKIAHADLESLATRFHIRKLSLFGSAARGELRPDSDIDLLVEFEPGKAPSLGGMLEISDAFSVMFGGREVDLATASILENPYRRRAIERDLEMLYAA